MFLHENGEFFKEIVLATSAKNGYEPAFVEKDYFVTIFLLHAVKRIPGLIFKGGTALSKCYNVIDRFSEDVDLTLDTEHFSQGKKRNSIKELIAVCDELNLRLLNESVVKSHTHSNYNLYEIQYPRFFTSRDVKLELDAEMTFIQKAYPSETRKVISYIGEFLLDNGDNSLVDKYDLKPFEIQVQTLERTFVDKAFALCDYYISKKAKRNSRHIYDIYKILTKIDINDSNLKQLVTNVRNDRMKNKTCFSAQEGVDINRILEDIIKSEFFKDDYKMITSNLLRTYVSYDAVIKSLDAVIRSGLFIDQR